MCIDLCGCHEGMARANTILIFVVNHCIDYWILLEVASLRWPGEFD